MAFPIVSRPQSCDRIAIRVIVMGLAHPWLNSDAEAAACGGREWGSQWHGGEALLIGQIGDVGGWGLARPPMALLAEPGDNVDTIVLLVVDIGAKDKIS